MKKIIIYILIFLILCPIFIFLIQLSNSNYSVEIVESTININSDDSTYVLLIITPEEFREEADRLRKFKSQTKRPTLLLTLDYIYSNFVGVDEAEQVKKAIAHYEDLYGIKYVLLLGDCDQVPVRYVYKRLINSTANTVGAQVGNDSYYGVEFLPTDLYYADLYDSDLGNFCDWDYDNDGLYDEKLYDFAGGLWYEPTHNIDYVDVTPDVAVGRIPASNIAHVINYVDKVIDYELYAPGIYPDDWFKTAALVSGLKGGMWNPNAEIEQLNETAEILQNVGFETIKIYNDSWGGDLDWTKDNINSVISDGVGFINWHAHGNRDGWGGYNWHDLLYNNVGKLPIFYAQSCFTAAYSPLPHEEFNYTSTLHTTVAFDYDWPIPTSMFTEPLNPDPIQDVTNDIPTIAEDFLVRYGRGAIAYVGCVDVSLTGATETLNDGFFYAYSDAIHKYGSLDDTNVNNGLLGDVWINAIDYYCNQYNVYELAYRNKLERFNLFGDPSLYIGGLPKQEWIAGEDLLHWNGSLWVPHLRNFPASLRLNAIQMLSPMDGFAVGEMGTILRWNGHTWSNFTSPTTKDLYSLDFLSTTDGWAVGAQGTMLHWDGTSWNNYSSPNNLALLSVDLLDPWFGVAVGQTILHWNGTDWYEQEHYAIPILHSVSLYRDNYYTNPEGWAVGENFEICSWNGTTWESQSESLDFNLNSVDFCEDRCGNWLGIAVGANGVIHYYNGSQWNSKTPLTSNELHSVSIDKSSVGQSNLANFWAVGDSGTIIRGFFSELNSVIGISCSLATTYTSNDFYAVDFYSKNIPPVSKLADVSFYTGTTTDKVSFSGTNCYDFDDTFLEYRWDFGDGKTSSSKSPGNHYYPAGTFTVTLWLSDGRIWDVETKSVIIIEGSEVDFPIELFIIFNIVAIPLLIYYHRELKSFRLNFHK
jgi:hypothetical protein